MGVETTKSASRVMRFFSNPAVGIIGSSASVISVGLTVFLYLGNTTSRDLVYFVAPVKTAVARVGQSSRITIQVDDEHITRDVTATQIAIWNNGKESIREENLLGSGFLSVKTGPEHPIIDAKVLEVSRDEVVQLELDSSDIDNGRLSVKWAILEKDDAALLQLIYFGDEETPITVSADVQRPSQVRTLETKKVLNYLVVVLLLLVGVAIGFKMDHLLGWVLQLTVYKKLQFLLALIFMSAVILLIVWIPKLLRTWLTTDPPFGL